MIGYHDEKENWVFQKEPEDLTFEDGSCLAPILSELYDCVIMGSEFRLGDSDMAVDFYDYGTGKIVRFPYSQIAKLSEGKPITFYARDPEYSVGDWVEIGDCIPYEIIDQEGNIFTIRSEEGQIKTVTMEDVSPYID